MSLGKVKVEDLSPCYGCCCMITSCYLKFPECLGAFAKGTCLCFSCDEVCCKMINSGDNADGKCCICCEGRCVCLSPNSCCANMGQCCCLDCRSAFPCTKDVPCIVNFCFINCCANWGCKCAVAKQIKDLMEVKSEPVAESEKSKIEGTKAKQQEATDVDVGQLRSCFACCCCLQSLYLEFPKCMGSKCEGKFLCCSQEQALCVPLCMNDTGDEKLWCVCQEGGCYAVMPSTCCLGQAQCCCCDNRCAFPCADQVPCLFGCLGCLVNKNFKCTCCVLNKEIVYQAPGQA